MKSSHPHSRLHCFPEWWAYRACLHRAQGVTGVSSMTIAIVGRLVSTEAGCASVRSGVLRPPWLALSTRPMRGQ